MSATSAPDASVKTSTTERGPGYGRWLIGLALALAASLLLAIAFGTEPTSLVRATLYPKSFADFATTGPTYLQPWTVTA